MKTISRILSFSFLLFIVLTGCKKTDEPLKTKDPRGEIFSTTLLYHFSPAQCDSIFEERGLNIVLSAKTGLDIYKVIYKTIDWKDGATIASGLIIIPTDVTEPLDMASYQHGTLSKKSNAPSQNIDGEAIVGIAFSADSRYLCVVPDYLGLGESPGIHPYVHSKTEASEVIDIIRAARHLCTEKSITLSEKLFLLGYSQGGHATVAAQKEIETNYSSEFKLAATAPLSGPYNVSGVQADVIIKPEPYPSPGYLPYILQTYNEVYQIYPSVTDYMIEPYASFIPGMFDGNTEIGTIDNAMPAIPNEILAPEVLQDFRTNLAHPFRKALIDNDLIDWKPVTPMQMCACTGDMHVSYQNALVAYYSFVNKGSSSVVYPTIIEGSDHQSCAFPALLASKAFFENYR
ncbi:MAG: lipase family protein [Bacteroidia bacterium]|nr:lipase family protein [Bacteroidia bacterium]